MTNSKGRMKAGVKCRLMATVAELGLGRGGDGGICRGALAPDLTSSSPPNEDGPFLQHKSDADEDERPVFTNMFPNDTS